jgi:hypothetical protein
MTVFRRIRIPKKAVAISIIGIFSGLGFSSGDKGAIGSPHGAVRFEFTGTTWLAEAQIGPQGGSVTISAPGHTLDGTSLLVPPHALNREILVRLGEDEGRVNLRSGQYAGVCLVMDTGDANSFEEPATIRFRYDAQRHPGLVIGNCVLKDGSTDALMQSAWDRKDGTISFITFVPRAAFLIYAEE